MVNKSFFSTLPLINLLYSINNKKYSPKPSFRSFKFFTFHTFNFACATICIQSHESAFLTYVRAAIVLGSVINTRKGCSELKIASHALRNLHDRHTYACMECSLVTNRREKMASAQIVSWVGCDRLVLMRADRRKFEEYNVRG